MQLKLLKIVRFDPPRYFDISVFYKILLGPLFILFVLALLFFALILISFERICEAYEKHLGRPNFEEKIRNAHHFIDSKASFRPRSSKLIRLWHTSQSVVMDAIFDPSVS